MVSLIISTITTLITEDNSYIDKMRFLQFSGKDMCHYLTLKLSNFWKFKAKEEYSDQ